MNKEELVELICEWECEAGESFTDYYMHDNIPNKLWATWLFYNGYAVHGQKLLDIIASGETYIDQEELYEIYPVYNDNEYNEENNDKNIAVWSEFFLDSNNKNYLDDVLNFLKDFLKDV